MLETIVFSILADMNRCTMTLLVVAWPTVIALLCCFMDAIATVAHSRDAQFS